MVKKKPKTPTKTEMKQQKKHLICQGKGSFASAAICSICRLTWFASAWWVKTGAAATGEATGALWKAGKACSKFKFWTWKCCSKKSYNKKKSKFLNLSLSCLRSCESRWWSSKRRRRSCRLLPERIRRRAASKWRRPRILVLTVKIWHLLKFELIRFYVFLC